MTIFVTKGDLFLTPAQLEKRAQKHIARSWSPPSREKSIRLADGTFDTFMAAFSIDHDLNTANNTFNWQLQEYRKATARLEQYVLADGRAEYTIETPTGTFDDDGEEIIETTTVPAIEPLDAQVEIAVYNDEGEQTGTEMVDNPLIAQDDEGRAGAQSVIDVTPQAVKDF
jgi:hypothetical protein